MIDACYVPTKYLFPVAGAGLVLITLEIPGEGMDKVYLLCSQS